MPLIFSFSGNRTEFECEINCSQCTGICANGNVCKRRACIGIPLCWSHLLRDKHIRIRPSTIRGGGKGLFATNQLVGENAILFQEEDIIIEYSGEVINTNVLDERYGDDTAPYAVQTGKRPAKFEDAACTRGVGAIANHGSGDIVNAKYSTRGSRNNRRSVLRATRPIFNNEEIFTNYGDEYNLQEQGVIFKTYRRR